MNTGDVNVMMHCRFDNTAISLNWECIVLVDSIALSKYKIAFKHMEKVTLLKDFIAKLAIVPYVCWCSIAIIMWSL